MYMELHKHTETFHPTNILMVLIIVNNVMRTNRQQITSTHDDMYLVNFNDFKYLVEAHHGIKQVDQ